MRTTAQRRNDKLVNAHLLSVGEVCQLIEDGAKVSTWSYKPIINCIKHENLDCLKIILSSTDVDINIYDGLFFRTACYSGHTSVVRLLLDNQVDVKKCKVNSKFGNSILSRPVSDDILDLLIDYELIDESDFKCYIRRKVSDASMAFQMIPGVRTIHKTFSDFFGEQIKNHRISVLNLIEKYYYIVESIMNEKELQLKDWNGKCYK
jgi:hypothetical protein